MHHPSTLKTNIQTSFFYKTIAHTVLKFYMEHDLPQGLRIIKLGQVEYPRWPPLLKIAEITKSTFSPDRWIFLAEFWHEISMEHRYSELSKITK